MTSQPRKIDGPSRRHTVSDGGTRRQGIAVALSQNWRGNLLPLLVNWTGTLTQLQLQNVTPGQSPCVSRWRMESSKTQMESPASAVELLQHAVQWSFRLPDPAGQCRQGQFQGFVKPTPLPITVLASWHRGTSFWYGWRNRQHYRSTGLNCYGTYGLHGTGRGLPNIFHLNHNTFFVLIHEKLIRF